MKAEGIRNSLVIFLILLSTADFAQSKYIFFYRPYTDSIETNLYKDTDLKFDYRTQYASIKNAVVAKMLKMQSTIMTTDLSVLVEIRTYFLDWKGATKRKKMEKQHLLA